jgi:mono/diheme cytochrome c family protein
MRHHTLLVTGIIAIVLGVTGLAVTFAVSSVYPGGSLAAYASIGQQIYYTGTDAQGPIPFSIAGGGMMGFGMVNGLTCAGCHGPDGRGGRVGTMYTTLTVPDIRYSTLTSSHTESGTVVPGWTDADIARAVRDGVDPSGQPLLAPMPRWNMSDTDMTDLIGYLKELDRR